MQPNDSAKKIGKDRVKICQKNRQKWKKRRKLKKNCKIISMKKANEHRRGFQWPLKNSLTDVKSLPLHWNINSKKSKLGEREGE